MHISAVILTKNEEKLLEKCLSSVLWCNEILLIDDYSTDTTKKIAQKYSAKIIEHALNNNFSNQRNFGLEHAKGEWVLFVDADEVVSKELRDEIEEIVQQDSQTDGFFIKRIDTVWGKQMDYGELRAMWLLRFAKRNIGFWQGSVHETWQIKGKTKRLKNPLFHYPHPDITTFLTDINFYTTLRAQELYEKGVNTNFLSILFYPKAKFFVNYVLKKGYKDGLHGFIFALFMSLHSFLVRAKLWQLWEKKK